MPSRVSSSAKAEGRPRLVVAIATPGCNDAVPVRIGVSLEFSESAACAQFLSWTVNDEKCRKF